MIRTTVGVLGAATLMSVAVSAGAPAHAAGSVTVTASGCNTVKITNTTATTQYLSFDGGDFAGAKRGVTTTLTLPGGEHSWLAANDTADMPTASGQVSVKPCSGTKPRPVDGDQNGDRRADVLGIQDKTGTLYYYRMGAAGLADGVKAGTGWNTMVFMQQVNEIEGAGSPNVLIAVRNDGTVWRYDNRGYGRFANGRQIGSGLAGYTNFTITQTNSMVDWGGHALLASKGDNLHAFLLTNSSLERSTDPAEDIVMDGWGTTTKTISTRDFDGDGFADIISIRQDGTMWADILSPRDIESAPRRVGHGWGAMQTVTSPGSLDGDRRSDLVARRSDGNLYKYINKGGYWAPAVQIGTNWQGIRLLA
ncbi:hypothetical protein GCM10027030_18150 [Luteococcus sediminum]